MTSPTALTILVLLISNFALINGQDLSCSNPYAPASSFLKVDDRVYVVQGSGAATHIQSAATAFAPAYSPIISTLTAVWEMPSGSQHAIAAVYHSEDLNATVITRHKTSAKAAFQL